MCDCGVNPIAAGIRKFSHKTKNVVEDKLNGLVLNNVLSYVNLKGLVLGPYNRLDNFISNQI